MTTFTLNAYPKSKQLAKTRTKLTQKQMGDISTKVDKQLKSRSNGICELRKRCTGAWAVQRAHITARKRLTHKTTVEDLLHCCLQCHVWLDQTPEGINYKRKLQEEAI